MRPASSPMFRRTPTAKTDQAKTDPSAALARSRNEPTPRAPRHSRGALVGPLGMPVVMMMVAVVVAMMAAMMPHVPAPLRIGHRGRRLLRLRLGRVCRYGGVLCGGGSDG